MSSKFVLTATALVLGIVGVACSVAPASFVVFWHIEPSAGATYLGNRMGTLLFGLSVTTGLGYTTGMPTVGEGLLTPGVRLGVVHPARAPRAHQAMTTMLGSRVCVGSSTRRAVPL